MTLLILLGPAVEDSDNDKDVYTAFLVRMGLFVAVTFLHGWPCMCWNICAHAASPESQSLLMMRS